jgi:hypothetical protein
MGIRTSFNPFGVDFSNGGGDPTSNLNGNFTNIIYSSGTYVAVAAGQTAGAYSTDGINWYDMVLPGKAKLNCLAGGVVITEQPLFVVVIDNDSSGDSLAWSLNGINWNLYSLEVDDFDCVGLAAGGDSLSTIFGIQNTSRKRIYCYVTYDSHSNYEFHASISNSNLPDNGSVAINFKPSPGSSWGGDMVVITDATNDYFYFADDSQNYFPGDILPVHAVYKHVAGSQDRWFAVGTSVNYTVLTSTDGINWTIDNTATNSEKNRICGGVEGTSARFLTVNGTKYFDVYNAYGWTTLEATNKMNDVCWNGTNFVTCGNNGNNKLVINIIPPNITGWVAEK